MAQGKQEETARRLLARAQLLCGGESGLAQRLGASPADLAGWVAGRALAPWPMVEKCINIILDACEPKS